MLTLERGETFLTMYAFLTLEIEGDIPDCMYADLREREETFLTMYADLRERGDIPDHVLTLERGDIPDHVC